MPLRRRTFDLSPALLVQTCIGSRIHRLGGLGVHDSQDDGAFGSFPMEASDAVKSFSRERTACKSHHLTATSFLSLGKYHPRNDKIRGVSANMRTSENNGWAGGIDRNESPDRSGKIANFEPTPSWDTHASTGIGAGAVVGWGSDTHSCGLS